MKQKTKLTTLLIIGLISLIGLVSCNKKVEYLQDVNFVYSNVSSKDLKIDCYSYNGHQTKTVIINSKDQLTGLVKIGTGGGVWEGVAFPYEDASDLIISFDDKEIKWNENDTSSRNPLLLSNYETINNIDGTYVLSFTFVESDFSNIVP